MKHMNNTLDTFFNDFSDVNPNILAEVNMGYNAKEVYSCFSEWNRPENIVIFYNGFFVKIFRTEIFHYKNFFNKLFKRDPQVEYNYSVSIDFKSIAVTNPTDKLIIMRKAIKSVYMKYNHLMNEFNSKVRKTVDSESI